MTDCVVAGVGESIRSRRSGRSVLSLAVEASRRALEDCGIEGREVDAVLGYQDGDSCTAQELAAALGAPAAITVDILGGGTCVETLIAEAVGHLSEGRAHHVLVFRSLNGRSGIRMGGGGGWSSQDWMAIVPFGSYQVPYGMFAAAQRFALLAVRHMHETGLSEMALARICETFYRHAQDNPNALLHDHPLSIDEYFGSPFLVYPFRLHDCCVESDEANALVITTLERARDLPCRPVLIEAVIPRTATTPLFHYSSTRITDVAGDKVARLLFATAGVDPSDVDIAGFYDCFSWVVARQLEAFGFTEPGETAEFIEKGGLGRDGRLPSNTAGGQLAEGYTHGMNNLLEVVRQLRGEYAGQPRAVPCTRGLVTGWGGPSMASGLLLRRP